MEPVGDVAFSDGGAIRAGERDSTLSTKNDSVPKKKTPGTEGSQ